MFHRHTSANSDLPLPHGLAPSETMVSIPPLSAVNPMHKGFSETFLSLAHPFLDLVLQIPRPRGKGRPLFAEHLDGPATRNTNRGDSRELIRANRFTVKNHFHKVRAVGYPSLLP